MLNSPSFQATTTEVVAAAVTPVLIAASQANNPADVLATVSAVTNTIAQEASEVVSGFDFDETSTDVSDLVTSFVTERVTGNQTVTIDTLQSIADGTTNVTDVVADTGDVSQVQDDLVNFINDNPDLVEGDGTDVIQAIPTGTWNLSIWNNFNWG